MFSCQSIQNIFVEIMKLKFGQDFEIEFLFKLEFKKLGEMAFAFAFAISINNPKYQPVSLYN